MIKHRRLGAYKQQQFISQALQAGSGWGGLGDTRQFLAGLSLGGRGRGLSQAFPYGTNAIHRAPPLMT